jgi:catechol 2,3-dioxygenase-like lactoylglutathione lyase family enzyme
MACRITEIAVDCTDPEALARFWTAALGYEVGQTEDGYVELVPPEGAGPAVPTIGLLRVPEPKAVKNRLHLDVSATDRTRDEEVERLLALGATRADVGQGPLDSGGVTWVVLADPEGNEFCVLRTRVDPLA